MAEIPWADSHEDTPLSLKEARGHCDKLGIAAPASFAQDSEECAAWELTYGETHKFVAAVRDYRRANILLTKLEAMERRVMDNGRMAFDLKYHGAHTARWAGGGGLNLQNLSRLPFRGIYLRNLLVPASGQKFVICDFSQIEPRVLAALSCDLKLLEALRAGYSVYEAQAVSWGLWRGNAGTLKTNDLKLYTFIKSLSLGCGYGLGPERFAVLCTKMGLNLSLPEAMSRVELYRRNSPKTVQYWEWLQWQFKQGLGKGMVQLPLKSGRVIRYDQPVYYDRSMWATVQSDKGYRRTKIWGGVLTENVVSGTARDILATAILRLERAGLSVVLHAHDEVVVECDKDISPQEIERLITRPVKWLPELPLAAEAKEAWRYGK
jgi:DNA polymerase